MMNIYGRDGTPMFPEPCTEESVIKNIRENVIYERNDDNVITLGYILDYFNKMILDNPETRRFILTCNGDTMHKDEMFINDELEEIDFRGFDFYCNIGIRAKELKSDIQEAVDKFFEKKR